MPYSVGSRPASASRGVLPGAVSVLTSALVDGAPLPAVVLGVHDPALYLEVAGRVLPVLTSDAVALAPALRLAVPSGRVRWQVSAGDVVTVGGGRVVLPGFEIAAARTEQWDEEERAEREWRTGDPEGQDNNPLNG